MITDIPEPDDFKQQGIAFLNLSWSTVLNLLLQLQDAIEFSSEYEEGEGSEEGISEAYWRASQHSLATAISLAYQGTEFLIKGAIARVSPFLLLSGEWVRGSAKQDTPFSQFHTIQADEVIKVHNIVAATRLDEAFQSQFERLRGLRNTITHTVDKRLKVTAKEIIVAVLSAVETLIGPQSWLTLRKEWLKSEPLSVTSYDDASHHVLAREMAVVVELLSASEVKKHFGFDRKQRRYVCVSCANSADGIECLEFTFAQLTPNTPDSTFVTCFLCGTEDEVFRCPCPKCDGNVISTDYQQCLTCGSRYETGD